MVEQVRSSIVRNLEVGDMADRQFLGGMLHLVDAYLAAKTPAQFEVPNLGMPDDITLPETFGRRVVFYRSLRGLSQKALARKVGLDPTHFNRIEREFRNPPAMGTVVAIAKCLHLPESHESELLKLAGYYPHSNSQSG